MVDGKNHIVFYEIDCFRDFYDNLSTSCLSIVPTGAPGATNYASYIYQSLRGNLNSIGLLLKEGQLTDAFTLGAAANC